MRNHLNQLLEAAAKYQMSAVEMEEQRRSFAFGNANLENEHVTRETIEQAATELGAERDRDRVA